MAGNRELVNQKAAAKGCGPWARNERTGTGAGASIVRPPRAMAYDRSSLSFYDLGIIVLLVAPARWLKPKVCFELPPQSVNATSNLQL
jgi:hypothetical protein